MTSKHDTKPPTAHQLATTSDDSGAIKTTTAEQEQSSDFLDADFPDCCVLENDSLETDSLENDSQNADSANHSSDEHSQDNHNEDENHSKEAKIYYPDAKATLTTISDEEVLVTVANDTPESRDSETADIETASSELTNSTIADLEITEANTANTEDGQFADKTSLNEKQATETNAITLDIDATQANSLANDVHDSAIESSHETEDSVTNITENSEDEAEKDSDEEDAYEEVKEQKEAKLESYKQFVAEQFSNQKVDYPEVRVKIEANALPSKMYFIMNILSAIIASYGLVTNSAAVVIGAMLVAMMLGPITGVALAIIDHRMPLLWKSLFTVVAGVSLVVIVGFLIGLLHNDQPLTAEILSRTQPTSMDLMIALAGGTAGAYAMVSPHLSVAVVGVAVATALVPPLAASGILFAHGEMQLGLGALLLAITNIIAIQFTNALVLWILGFRRLVDDDYKTNSFYTFCRRNAVTLILLGVLGSYLTINLKNNAKQQVFESSTKEAISSYFIDKGNVLTNTQFDTSDENQVVRAVIRGETTPSSYDVRQIEEVITENMAVNFPDYLPIKLQLRYLPVQVIEANPLVTDKLDRTDAAILTN